jgi:hypothetical protein
LKKVAKILEEGKFASAVELDENVASSATRRGGDNDEYAMIKNLNLLMGM